MKGTGRNIVKVPKMRVIRTAMTFARLHGSLIQLDGNLASDVSTRCSGRPQGNSGRLVNLWAVLYLRAWLLIIWRVIM